MGAHKARIASPRCSEEGRDGPRVKLAAGAARELNARLFVIACHAVRAIAGHRHVCIGDRQDACLQGDLLATQAARITAAVGALAVAEDPLPELVEAGVAEERGSELGLAADLRAL